MTAIKPSLEATPQRVSIARQRLREVTSALHAQVDGLFADGLDSLLSYRRYLLGMHRFAVDYEFAIDALPRHSAALARDLVALALPPLFAVGRQRRVADHCTRLGWEYVMAGSSLGARRLLRDARRLGLDAGNGASFLVQHAAGDDWPALLARLDAFASDDARQMAAAEAGACDAFSLVHACFVQSFDLLPDDFQQRTACESRT